MTIKKLLFYYLFLLAHYLHSQNDYSKLNYEELKNIFFENKKNKKVQEKCAKAYLDLAKNRKNNSQIVRAYYLFSLANKGDKAIQYLDSVIKYSYGTNDDNFPNSAYCEKASILQNQFKYKEALENYLLAEKYALDNKRMIDYYNVKFFIGISKSENLGEVDEALKIYKEVFNYFKINHPNNYIYPQVIFGMADAYKTLKVTDSATYYNKLGFRISQKSKYKEMLYLFRLNEGANLVLKKKYQGALDSISKALVDIKKFDDKANLMAAYFYFGKIYEGLGNNSQTIKNYIRVDSIYEKEKIMYPELIEGYQYLINHYKRTNDKTKQLLFLNKFISIDSVFQKNHNIMYKLLVKEYDLPNLVKEKENLIQSLKSNNNIYFVSLIFFSIIIIVFVYYHYSVKKRYKKRFKEIIEDYQSKQEHNNSQNHIPKKNQSENIDIKNDSVSKTNTVPKDVVTRILKNLEKFEREKKYLQKDITLQSLAKELETNNLYLSRTINIYKEKKFNEYINDLRIDECLYQLQTNNQLLKYTIDAIANEFGFNNENTFSVSFQKRMKLKPGYFMNELKNIKHSE